jgi:hypothetical protein
MLTYHHPPSTTAVRSTNRLRYAGPFLAPGKRGRNGLPRQCRFWVVMHTKVDYVAEQKLINHEYLLVQLIYSGIGVFESVVEQWFHQEALD